MSLDKAIKHGKEKREPYRKSKAIDPHCRNHGQCPYCTQNRTFDRSESLEDLLKEVTPENINKAEDWDDDTFGLFDEEMHDFMGEDRGR